MEPIDAPRASEIRPADVAATFCATLVDEWIELGVRHAMAAPGSRSTPLVLALAARAEIDLQIFHDERSAAFAALGAGVAGSIAIAVCTSGTAAAHFHAAVIEADLSHVPMIVCTTDRPPELRDVGAPQTIDQTALYGRAVRWFHDPGIARAEAAPTWRSLAAHALGRARGVDPGPVQINLPFAEPLIGVSGPLPARPNGFAVATASTPIASADAIDAVTATIDGRRGVIVAGRGCGDPDAVAALARALGWPVFADSRSGIGRFDDIAVRSADALLRDAAFVSEHRADVVLRVGEPPASKVVNQWMATATRQLVVIPYGGWSDPSATASMHIVADAGDVCERVAKRVSPSPVAWLAGWVDAERRAQQAIDESLSADSLTDPRVARTVADVARPGWRIVVSSSMPVRDLEWYGCIGADVIVHSNRGANGIDGVIATATGAALITGAPTVVLLGDIAFLHDSSSLTALRRRAADLRIVVVDNDGGAIFGFLAQAEALERVQFERLFGTPHGADIAAVAAAHGLDVTRVDTDAELRVALDAPGPTVTVVRTDRWENIDAHRRISAAVAAAISAD